MIMTQALALNGVTKKYGDVVAVRDLSFAVDPGEMFGLGKGIRFGYGYDIEHTLKGLARVDLAL